MLMMFLSAAMSAFLDGPRIASPTGEIKWTGATDKR